jgi:YHS domain-containing protein
MYRDHVCGLYVDPAKSNWAVEHAGKDYFFCSEACQSAFASDPERFLSKGTRSQAQGTPMGSMGGCCGGGSGNGRRGFLNTAIILILILMLLFR